jgi:hypothetical protein
MAGKVKDRLRPKKKRRKRMSQMPQDLEIMAAQATKRFRVTVVQQRVDEFTIWATDPNHAGDLVVKQGQGRPAGSRGPAIVDVKVQEYGEGVPENAHIVESAQIEQSKTEQKLIEVVGS